MAGAFYGKQLNHPKYLIKPNQFTEIERKFLLDSFPTDLPLKEEFQVYQAYLSINPEKRFCGQHARKFHLCIHELRISAFIDVRAFQQQAVRKQINAEVLGDERLRHPKLY